MSQEIKTKLAEIIAEVAEIDEVPETTPFADLGIDSMMAIEIVAEVERQYKISIAEEELAELTDLAKVHARVLKSLDQNASA
ncbi:MAG: acyl carrier protein [Myxococcota bacterium]